MRLILTVAAVLALCFAAPASATMVESPEKVSTAVDRVALEQHAIALSAEIDELLVQLKSSVEAAGEDRSRASAQVDALIQTFQPRLDNFLETYNRFYDGMLANAADDATRSDLLAGRDESILALKAMPSKLREQALAPVSTTGAITP